MNQHPKHIIDKLQIEINHPQIKDTRQNVLSERIQSAVVDGVESFGKKETKFNPSKTLRFDRIILTIDFSHQNTDRLKTDVEKELAAIIEGAETSEKGFSRSERNFESEERSLDEKKEDLFLFFLENGTFPWWATTQQSPMLALDAWLEERTVAEWNKKYIPALRSGPAAVKRLVYQFPEHILRKLLALTSPQDASFHGFLRFIDLTDRFSRRHSAKLTAGFADRFKHRIYESVFDRILLSNKDDNSELFNQTIIDSIRIISRYLPPPLPREWIDFLKADGDRQIAQWTKQAGVVKKPDSQDESLQIESEPKSLFMDLPVPKKLSGIKEFDIPQAGLVLLHPFISRLFDKSGYLKDGKFRSPEKRERAVCLLHHLATGKEEFPEPALVLPMLLCSWPVGIPVNRFLPLSNDEKEECQRLLESATGHWDALKKTTPEGLRVNFLIRNGRLKKGEFGWTLYIENKTHDILIDRMPWGISSVKFKWMKELLTVNWRNTG